MTGEKNFIGSAALPFVIVGFFSCGFLYLLFPGQHYTYGWAVYVKYIFLVLGIVLGSITASAPRTFSIEHFLLAAWAFCLISAMIMGAEGQRAILYGLPAVALLMPRETRTCLPLVAFSVLLLALFGAGYEALVVGGFKTFADLGYRASSIFLNPNNMAIAAVLLLAYAMQLDNKIFVAMALVSCAILVIFSGSKAGLALFALLMVWSAWCKNPKVSVLVFVIAVGLTLVGLSMDWFRAPYLSLYFRGEQIAAFVQDMGNPIFPFAFRNGAAPYVDNVYLQTWNEMGLPAAIVLLAAIVHVALRDGSRSPLWMVFAAAGLSENFVYLWPLAYIFWTYVAAERPRVSVAAPEGLMSEREASFKNYEPTA